MSPPPDFANILFMKNNALADHYSRRTVMERLGVHKTYYLLRVTAVLPAKDDGSKPLYDEINGKIVPKEPWLRNSTIHKNSDQNFIRDAVELANLQLLYSGANFGLDIKNIKYVSVNDTILHQRDCGPESDKEEDKKKFEKEVQHTYEKLKDYIKDSVILLYRWGKENPDVPYAGQACGGDFILMPGRYRTWSQTFDGVECFGNAQLTHEFGHYLGLPHPQHECLEGILAGIVSLEGRNKDSLPLTVGNLPKMPGVTEDDIKKAKNKAIDAIKNYKQGSDDPYKCAEIFDNDYSSEIHDTPIDLGIGLPLAHGDPYCTCSKDYSFERYDGSKLNVSMNQGVRINIMNYCDCDPEKKIFSPDQVKKMQYILHNIKPNVIGTTIKGRNLFTPELAEKTIDDFVPPYKRPDPRIMKRYCDILDQNKSLKKSESAVEMTLNHFSLTKIRKGMRRIGIS